MIGLKRCALMELPSWGDCPHGISGKNCSSYHPPWCYRLQSNGPGGKRGCSKASDKCRFFHPPLCQNALATGVCLSKGCKEVHIKGTITSEKGLKKSKDSTTSKHLRPSNKQSHKPGPPSPKRGNDSKQRERERPRNRTEEPVPRRRERTESMTSHASDPGTPSRKRSVSFSKSDTVQENEDFLKHLSLMKADINQQIATAIQTAIQTMNAAHQQHQAAYLQHFAPHMYHQMMHSPQFHHNNRSPFHHPHVQNQ